MGWGRVWIEVVCPCPPVHNDIVTPRHFFFLPLHCGYLFMIKLQIENHFYGRAQYTFDNPRINIKQPIDNDTDRTPIDIRNSEVLCFKGVHE